jgi:PTH1 family peptidyl-tRNA hydrolase
MEQGHGYPCPTILFGHDHRDEIAPARREALLMRLWPRRQGTSFDLLVVGLGNPGREYARNRHNVGWLVVDELARRHDGAWKGKFNGQLAEIRIDGHKVALLKPETFMNESGRSVQAALRFYKLQPDAVLVVHDDSDLETGRLQARPGGGLAGHNGLRSVAKHLGTPDFLRLRVGVGRPGRGDRRPLADYVLSDFEPHDDADALVARAANAVETLDTEGLEAAQRAYNAKR